jgi:hypothetical protein
MSAGVEVDGSPSKFIGNEPWTYTVAPHRVVFERTEAPLRYMISYEFCLSEPAMVVTFRVTNISGASHDISVKTHCAMSLRTCQTYARKDSALTTYDSKNNLIRADFDDAETGQATVFVKNAAADPIAWTVAKEKGPPAADFEYQQRLSAKDSFEIVQIVGSCRRSELTALSNRLSASWKENVDAYDEFVRLKSDDVVLRHR